MLKPLADKLVVRRDPVEKQSKGGLWLPDTAKEKYAQTGVVVSVGPGSYDFDFEKHCPIQGVKVGDKVAFLKYAGTNIPDEDGTEFLVLKEEEVLCVIV